MHYRIKLTGLLACLLALVGCAHQPDTAREASAADGLRVVPVTDLEWGHLNPARGDASPRAANLWGDRRGEQATGFLVRFVPGFSSPAHIHNVSYRAVVIEGKVHNDDPFAAHQWMGPGSFWTQPAGESHITAAGAERNLALVEIDTGPYLVHAAKQAFDNGEQPLNLAADNLVWLPAPVLSSKANSGGAEVAYLWGSFEHNAWSGTFLKLPAGFRGRIESAAPSLHAVLISGQINRGSQLLTPGGYFGLDGSESNTKEAGTFLQHTIANTHSYPAVLYIRSNGPYRLLSDSK